MSKYIDFLLPLLWHSQIKWYKVVLKCISYSSYRITSFYKIKFRCILLNFSTTINEVLQVIITVFLKGTLPQDVVSRTSRKWLSIVKRPYIIIQTHSRKAVRCLAWTRSHKILWHRLPISNTSLHVSQYPTPSSTRPTITTSSTLQHEHPQHQPPSSTLVWWNPECGICTVQESVMVNWRWLVNFSRTRINSAWDLAL